MKLRKIINKKYHAKQKKTIKKIRTRSDIKIK